MKEIEDFLEYWESKGVTLPNPDNYPKTFAWYVKLYKYYKSR